MVTEDLVFDYAGWQQWLFEQESKTTQVYQDDPIRLLGDYRQEKHVSLDYQGREILELLQNANDAAAELDTEGKVRIELNNDGLIIANQGKYFTPEGIESFRVIHVSPKLFERKHKLIGQKGLGFRAVLNWSRNPVILSGALNLTYHETKLRKVEAVLKTNPKLREIIASETKSSNEIILPVLPFPELIDHQLPDTCSDQHKSVFARCMELRDSYDTVVGMPFQKTAFFDAAKQSLIELRPEILLFIENISEISIQVEKLDPIIWRKSKNKEENTCTLFLNNDSMGVTWKLFEDKSSISIENLSEKEEKEYEIVIAVPTEQPLKTPTKLFSFFPTDFDFPFPVVCHATLELEANRKYPQDGEVNKYILMRIAEYLTEVAESVELNNDPWRKCRLLARVKDYDSALSKFNFGRVLIDKAKGKNIIPTIDHQLNVHSVVKRLPNEIQEKNVDWLPTKVFSDLCLSTQEKHLQEFLKEIGVEQISNAEICNRFNRLEIDSVKERAKIIANLLMSKIIPQGNAPYLLIDSSSEVIKETSKVFFAPESEKTTYVLPDWLSVRFLNEDLRLSLSKILNTKDRRDLRQRLDYFGVQEYSLSTIAVTIANETNDTIKAGKHDTSSAIEDMLYALYFLFDQGDAPSETLRSTFVPLISQSGKVNDSRTLYLGSCFGGNGSFLSHLFVNHPDKLVASLQSFGFEDNDEKTANFLIWLGVNILPREVIEEDVEIEYVVHVLNNLKYPVQFEDKRVLNRKEAVSAYIKRVKSLDCLDDILNTEPAAILAWLIVDHRTSQWYQGSLENGELRAYPDNVRHPRKYIGTIPSYVRWKIMNTPWLPTNSDKQKPCRCMLNEQNLMRVLPTPFYIKHPLLDSYDRGSIRRAWDNAGVMQDLSFLSQEELYRIILDIPNYDESGKEARTFYRTIIERVDPDFLGWAEIPSWFMSDGKMWGKGPEGEKYYSVKKMYHVDFEGVPRKLLDKLTLVDLPTKVGSQKVRKLYGIEPLGKKKIDLQIVRVYEIDGNAAFQRQFQRAKWCVYALRQVRTNRLTEIKKFKDLEIILCSTLEIEVSFEQFIVKTELEKSYDWILNGDIAYILHPEENPTLESDLLSDALGSVIADLFGLTQGGEFARLIRCSEHHRESLLKRMLGESESLDFDTIKLEFESFTDELPIDVLVPEDDATEMSNGLKQELVVPVEQSTEIVPQVRLDDGSGSITKVDQLPPMPPVKHQSRKIVRRIQYGSSAPNLTGLRRVTDGNVCEQRVEEFECIEGRFPLRVSGLTGHGGPKCDIISFRNKEDKFTFLTSGEMKSLSLVERFIEVKGRGSDDTPITLKGNELEAAKTYADLYYLYRLYQKPSGDYELIILQNPLNHGEALDNVVDVYVNRAQDTSRFELALEEKV